MEGKEEGRNALKALFWLILESLKLDNIDVGYFS